MSTPAAKTEVKKFTLRTFQTFCWTSSLIEDEFEAIVAKFFDCEIAELPDKDGLMLFDGKGWRWARTEEINYFLDYVSSQYLNLNEVKLEERPMDYEGFAEECGSIVLQIEGYIRAQSRNGVLSDYHDELLANFVRDQILRVKPYFDYLDSKVYLKVNVNQSKPLIIGGSTVYHEKGRVCHGR